MRHFFSLLPKRSCALQIASSVSLCENKYGATGYESGLSQTVNANLYHVPRDQVSPLLVVYGSLFLHII